MNIQGNMKFRTPTTAILAVCTSALLLTGCLTGSDSSSVSSRESGSGTADNTNRAPSISGNPPSAVLAGEAFSFTPDASDPDGDNLTFSIENRPGWATFDTRTGTLSGTPTMANIGSFNGIRISVSDAQESASMPDFSVEVMQTGPASITLSWSAPTQNEDGSALTDLAGYKLFYGRSSGEYTNVVQIDNPSVTTFVVENLAPATYYFAAKSFNASGIESAFSGEVVRDLHL